MPGRMIIWAVASEMNSDCSVGIIPLVCLRITESSGHGVCKNYKMHNFFNEDGTLHWLLAE